MTKTSRLFIVLFFYSCSVLAQADSTAKKDSLSGFDKFNKKAEALFRILPVPIYSYSPDAGNIFGLAKFNVLNISKTDTISKPSKLSEVLTFSTKGRVNASISTELVFHQNKYVVLSYFNYKKQPEYIFGIGNDVTKAGEEQIQYDRLKFSATGLVLVAKNLYVGMPLDISSYYSIQTDSNSFLVKDSVTGLNGGASLGFGFAAAYDTRDNRYNAHKGAYVIAIFGWHPKFCSAYEYTQFTLDARKFFNPWLKHIIAIQATTSYTGGNVPFYELSMLGGDSKMRGYYLGAFRDKVSVDAQVEYRMPVWNIFGIAGWIGTGRVADYYGNLGLAGFKLSYGGGLRIRVDSKHDTNLRFDYGFGPGGINGFYVNFGEAF